MTKQNFHELSLPQTCQSIEFISDLHLDAATPTTFTAWQKYMQTTQADAVFILGDLFESWVGDDILQAQAPLGDFERQCAQVIAQTAQKSHVYFMHGNRDFLIQQGFADNAHVTLLPDPTLLLWENQASILSHGDLLCTDDVKYQEYRKMVHNPAWQQQALAMPLQLRVATAQQMREKSEEAKKANAMSIMDVNEAAVTAWLQAANANTIIHGHTHRPADHTLPQGQKRIVLTDWDLDTTHNQRAEVLRWTAGSAIQRIQLITLGL